MILSIGQYSSPLEIAVINMLKHRGENNEKIFKENGKW